jgi:oligoribonuclease (3'-5' exoribonuclease)
MARYLSIDTETTGLHLDCHLIEVAFLPVDTETTQIDFSLGKETFVQCPSFEELKPTLNPWVIQHNEGLIRKAYATGITPEAFKKWVHDYFSDPAIKGFFKGERPPLLGKSLSALDIPILTRYLGKETMDKYFHHHTVDITSVARALVDSGVLPKGSEGTTKLVKFFDLKSNARHTAMSDAVDMAEIYLKITQYLRAHCKSAAT